MDASRFRMVAGRAALWLSLLASQACILEGTPVAAPTPTVAPAPRAPAQAPDIQATVQAAVRGTQEAARPGATPTSSGPGQQPTLAAAPATPTARAAAGPPSVPATSAPAAPGTGAPTPELAVQRAYEAAANGDNQALTDVTDPDLRGGQSPLRLLQVLGRGDRKSTLNNMQYQTVANDDTYAQVHVTGRVGNVPLVGERSIDETETARKIGDAWYLSRSRDGSSRR